MTARGKVQKMLLIVLAGLPAIAGGEADAASRATYQGRSLRIGTFLRAIDYAPYYVAKHDGCLDRIARSAGRQISYTVYSTIPAVNMAVNSGALDIILEADSPAILQLAAGAQIREIMPLAALDQQILVPTGSKLDNLAGLRNARIGVLFGSGYHFAIVDALRSQGAALETLNLVDIKPDAGDSALSSGLIDAWAIWPPILQSAVAAGKGRPIAGSTSTLNVYAFATRRFIRSNMRLVHAFAGCMHDSITAIPTRPKDAVRAVHEETGIAIDIIEKAWPTMKFGFRVDDESLRVLNRQAKFFLENGYIKKAVVFEPAFFLSGIRK